MQTRLSVVYEASIFKSTQRKVTCATSSPDPLPLVLMSFRITSFRKNKIYLFTETFLKILIIYFYIIFFASKGFIPLHHLFPSLIPSLATHTLLLYVTSSSGLPFVFLYNRDSKKRKEVPGKRLSRMLFKRQSVLCTTSVNIF